MKKNNALLAVFSSLLLLCVSAEITADVAPDPGFKRISLKLNVEAAEDLSDFRFFIKSGAEIKEVNVKPGEQTSISPLGGGAYYSSGKLLAIPKRELEKFSDASSGDKLSKLEKAVFDGQVPGTIELVDHLFARTVLEAEAAEYQDPVYRIERDPQARLKAVYVSGGANVGKPLGQASSGRLFWQSAGAVIVAGIFLAFGITILGVLYFRKKAKAL
ncbi:MAG: hypothetical protein ACJ72Z_02410 [Pyrinomonadaceae bacterium]